MGVGHHHLLRTVVSKDGVAYESRAAYTPLYPDTRSYCTRHITEIIKNGIPYLAFLIVYALNPYTHWLPRLEDAIGIHLYNVSQLEYNVLFCQPHEVVQSFHNVVFDVLAAVPYLLHYILPVLFPAYLFCTGRVDLISKFYCLLGITMWMTFIIWKLFPTAPPWMLKQLEELATSGATQTPIELVHREGCAFSRLDRITGVRFFFYMFRSNPVPFGSFPSGHVAWPVCIYVIGAPGGKLFSIYVLWIAWATLYTCHHYLFDALSAVVMVTIIHKTMSYIVGKLQHKKLSHSRQLCTPDTV